MSLLHFITAIPLNVERGSGCFVGTKTLIDALRALGIRIDLVTPSLITPVYSATRFLFNQLLRRRRFEGDVVIGIDADGYAIAGKRGSPPHIACIKGVLGDAVRFEQGITRASMAMQSRLEAKHARRADLIITVSRYCAARLEELYGVRGAVVVPELIDLDGWRALFDANPGRPDPKKFTVLSVCRFYPRKRLDLLLRAAAILRDRLPNLEIRIVGNGPERAKLQQMHSDLRLGATVRWLGHLSMDALAREYKGSDIFCLPSVQEGFGIVFLEAMAAGKPIVAARAAAVPEVVRNGLLVEPANPEALAEAILRLSRDADLRASLATAGERNVKQFAAPQVALLFIEQVATLVPALKNLTTTLPA